MQKSTEGEFRGKENIDRGYILTNRSFISEKGQLPILIFLSCSLNFPSRSVCSQSYQAGRVRVQRA